VNLVNGQLLDHKQCQSVLDALSKQLSDTLSKGDLDPQTVIDACDRLVRDMDEKKYLAVMEELGIARKMGEEYLRRAKTMFSREYLQERLIRELGAPDRKERRYTPLLGDNAVTERLMPLGVLLHIAAGNADGLPAFSVLEGLLTGNINILKLPEVDGGVSVSLLMELIQIEPKLAGYIYVFDYSSKDIKSITKLIDAADAVVVWGGDQAVSALRKMTGPDVKLIEWGHKISFAYVTEGGISDHALRGLAHNICRTDQLLCSSCQGIFLDTEDMETAYRFCERFLPILEEVSNEFPPQAGIGIVSQVTLELYNEELERLYNGSRIFRGKGCSIIAYHDSTLQASLQFRNCWVKPLPRERLLHTLRPYKNHLQTAALLCAEDERPALTGLLSKTGIVRVTDGMNMSDTFCGAAHDGEYPLRRYTKVFSIE
jgi:hypothetical protein